MGPCRWLLWKAAHPHEERIARRFRHHVRTPCNPRGRIHREPCGVCGLSPYEPDAEGRPMYGCPRVQAHHVDHAKPWLVAWLCDEHHRAVEAGRIRLGKRMLFDYSSLIEPITKPGLHRHGRGGRRVKADPSEDCVPF